MFLGRAFIFTVLSLLATQATATVFDNISSSVSVSKLVGRDGFDPGSIPASCTSKCTSVTTVAACTDDKCLCTDTNASGLNTCLSCIVAIDPTDDNKKAAQAILDKLVGQCKTASITVKAQTISKNSARRGSAHALVVGGSVVVAIGLGSVL